MSIVKFPVKGEAVARKRLSPEASRLAALEAARDILVEAGPQAVTLKAVAARIGRTHANLLHHFGSASGLQRELAAYHAETICVEIGEQIHRFRGGDIGPRDLVDMIFDHFDKAGAGALAAWMLLSGNEDALNPVVEAIHRLVDEVGEGGHEDGNLHELTMELVLLALGDSLLGGPLSASLGLDRGAGREIAAQRLEQSFSAWQARQQQ
ncbi:TetR/AcrR family transcriptional regulator [Sphingorhabdus sp.]|jgi:AcrR family transcriptional regulator|uniref:TetR/AcrR family transcriptional regulator n=1 Tax=Sphingorhabdus sp. TaxID=1902408 RepID=UPI0035B25278|nr:TetR/AcrR family transcriptional regulator [Sphingomonadaceae bacterium]